jgi:hypothetical protein
MVLHLGAISAPIVTAYTLVGDRTVWPSITIREILSFAGRLAEPAAEALEGPAIDDTVAGNSREARVSRRCLHIGELTRGVGIAVECKQASSIDRLLRQRIVEILTRGIAVELDGNARARRGREDGTPIRYHPGAGARNARPRMAQDPNRRILNRGLGPMGLVVTFSQQ